MVGLVLSDNFLLTASWEDNGGAKTTTGILKIPFTEPITSLLHDESELNAVSEEAKKTAKFRWIRKKRNNLLAKTDWWCLSDQVPSNEQQLYRKKLRDLPASNADPDKITFPTKPE